MNVPDYDEMIESLGTHQSKLNSEPCRIAADGGDRCLDPKPRQGWGDLNPDSMCGDCRTYWYISMAVHQLQLSRVHAMAVILDGK